ncbi:azurin [Sheuella amnicola]|uniref:azurin n=1 Tax=Sheuella amnicola TaxID=2707330 RepID=UPI0028833259|nr:azurin [Sheuella amnicola]
MAHQLKKWLFATGIVLAICGPTCNALAADCFATVESDDALRFTPSHIEVPASCQDFTIKLTHVGRLPKAAMGHNWVLVKSSDLEGVARTGMLAGAAHEYIDPTDRRVIAHSGLIGSGGSTSVTFAVNKLQVGQSYAFLCTFAGHSPIMQGTVSLKP